MEQKVTQRALGKLVVSSNSGPEVDAKQVERQLKLQLRLRYDVVHEDQLSVLKAQTFPGYQRHVADQVYEHIKAAYNASCTLPDHHAAGCLRYMPPMSSLQWSSTNDWVPMTGSLTCSHTRATDQSRIFFPDAGRDYDIHNGTCYSSGNWYYSLILDRPERQWTTPLCCERVTASLEGVVLPRKKFVQ